MNAVTSWMHENTLVLLLAVGTIFNIVWLTIQRNRVHIKTVGTIIISILHTLIGVGCVMVFALAEKGFDKVYGARPLRRAIQSKIEDRLSELILDKTITENSTCTVDYKDNEFTFNS